MAPQPPRSLREPRPSRPSRLISPVPVLLTVLAIVVVWCARQTDERANRTERYAKAACLAVAKPEACQ